MRDDKRKFRELKRAIKKAGNKKRRGQWKRRLAEQPEEAHADDPDFHFGKDSSRSLNGLDDAGG